MRMKQRGGNDIRDNNELRSKESKENTISTLKISFFATIIYLIIGALWIFLSDKVMYSLYTDKESILKISMYKGWIYVIVTGILAFILSYTVLIKIKRMQDKIINNYKEITKGKDKVESLYDELALAQEELENKYQATAKIDEALRISEEKYRLISDGTNDGIWDWDLVNDSAEISSYWSNIMGVEDDKINDFKNVFSKAIIGEDVEQYVLALEKQLSNKRANHYQNECRLQTKSGSCIWIYIRGKIVRDEQGNPVRIAGSITDITDRMNLQIKLEKMAYHDDLTNLPSKAMFLYHINLEMKKRLITQSKFAICYIHIENYHKNCDSQGHIFANKILLKFVEEVTKITHRDFLIARVSEDKFGVLITSVENKEELALYARRVINHFAISHTIGGKQIFISLSIGMALFPDDGQKIENLLRNADLAMYKAKEIRSNDFRVFQESFYFELLEKTNMERDLRSAVSNKSFDLHYQPQVNLPDFHITCFEALIRWEDPTRGWVNPADFIPLAEEMGLITEIGYWVIRSACKHLKLFESQWGEKVEVAVNISTLQILDDNFVENTKRIVEEEGINSGKLVFEVTESVIIESFEKNRNVLYALKEIGIKIALDDFGTGYSSLNYINQIPIDEIKIDKSFVDNLSTDPQKMAIVDTVIELSHRLNFTVTAEGVEKEEDLRYLIRKECDKVQGYIFSKPLTIKEILDINLTHFTNVKDTL